MMPYPSGRVTSHNLNRTLLKLLQFLQEILQQTKLTMNRMGLSVSNFTRIELIKVIYQRNRSQNNCLPMRLHNFSRRYTEILHNFLTEATESARSMGCYNFGKIKSIIVPKCLWSKQVSDLHSGNWSLPLHSCIYSREVQPLDTLS